MKQDKQQQIKALLIYYQKRVKLLSDKKIKLLKGIVRQSDDLKIAKVKGGLKN